MKFYLFLSRCLTVFLVCVGFAVLAQQRVVSGKITTTEDGSTLPGVAVVEKGTTNGTSTDGNGEFKISVSDNATLQLSFVGYKAQEVPVGSRNVVDVVMEPDVTSLGEIVVVGYGQQEKKDVTGSVVAIDSKDFNKGIMSSPQDLLLGKVAGVQITSADGSPGAGSTIRIRGANSLSGSSDPLIVIDGFPVDNSSSASVSGMQNPLTLINPKDIETFTVLKDASATAIYGMRAANGVIIITTKKGTSGKPHVSLNSSVSVSTVQKYFGVLTGNQFRQVMQERFDAKQPGITQDALNLLGTANTNWQKEVTQSAISHDQNISVSGTYKNLPYRVSYGYTDQQGLIKTTDLKRNTINVYLTPSFFDGDLQVNANFKGSQQQQNFGNSGVFGSAITYDPTQPVYDNNSSWGGFKTWTSGNDPAGTPITVASSNPVALLKQTSNIGTAWRGIGNLKLDYRLRFFPDIKLTMNAGFDYTTSKGYNNSPVTAAFTYGNKGGSLVNYTGSNKSRLLDLYANYSKLIGQHKIDVTAGYSYQAFEVNSSNFARNVAQNYFTDYTTSVKGIDTTYLPHQQVPQLNYLMSFFGRANYSYADKYLVSVSFRDDASSRFTKQNQWHVFPSAAIGWKINKEQFMQNLNFISDLKLRASWGVTGNQAIGGLATQNGSYPYLSVYQQGTPPNQYGFGSGYVLTQRPQAYDANIKWETTAQTDIGLDFGILKDRITGTVDVYQKNTSNLLNTIPVPGGSTYSNSLTTNVGSMTNKGIEFAIRALVVKSHDFEWNFGFNVAHNQNEVTKLLKNNDPTSYGNLVGGISGGLGGTIQDQQVGYPINSFFVYQQVYDKSGKPIEGLYVDQSGTTGAVTGTNANKIRYHSINPNAILGVNSRFAYKQWDFYFSGHASLGNWVYNNNEASKAYYGNLYYAQGYINNLPSTIFNTNFYQPQTYSSYYVQNASFFRMDNMSLGYSFKDLAQDRLKMRLSFTVQNAFFITKYKGIDPEVNSGGTSPGIDNALYPRPRIYMLGLTLTY